MRSFNIKINNTIFSEENFREIPDQLRIRDKALLFKIVQFLSEWSNNKKYFEIQTSGSTGKEKKIKLLKDSMLFSAQQTCNFFNLTSQSNGLLCLPTDYIAGKMMLVRAMVSGMNLFVTLPKSNPFEITEPWIDFAAITPFQLTFSLNSIKQNRIKTIIVGGASVSKELKDRIQELETEIYETFGMTETCSHIALKRLNGKNKSEYFQTLENVNIDTDERKCLVIEAPGLGISKMTTNDIVEIKSSNKFKWLGRADNIINSGGIKIFPEQIEKIIIPFINRAFYVSYEDDDKLGQKLVMVIEGIPMDKNEEKMLIKKISEKVPRYELPKKIKYVEEIKRTKTNKILRIP